MLWCLLYNLTQSCTGRRKRDVLLKMKGWKSIWEIWELISDGCCVVSVCVLVSRWGNRNVIWMLWCLVWSSLFTSSHTHSVIHRKKRKRLWKMKVGKERERAEREVCLYLLPGSCSFERMNPAPSRAPCYCWMLSLTKDAHTPIHTHSTHSLRAPCSHQ